MDNLLIYLKPLGLAILVALAPIQAAMITVMVLLTLDLIAGVWAASKQSIPITSRGLRKTITKILVYELVLIGGFISETYLFSGIFPITKILTAFVGLVEMKSLLENAVVIVPQLQPILSKIQPLVDKQQK